MGESLLRRVREDRYVYTLNVFCGDDDRLNAGSAGDLGFRLAPAKRRGARQVHPFSGPFRRRYGAHDIRRFTAPRSHPPRRPRPRDFRWTDTRRDALAAVRPWLLGAVIPLQLGLQLAFVRGFLQPARDTAGRDLMLLLCFVSAWLCWRLLAPQGVLASRSGGAVGDFSRRLLRLLSTISQLFLAALTLGGYLFTATAMERSFRLTAFLVLALSILHGLLSRWFLLSGRVTSRAASLRTAPASRNSGGWTHRRHRRLHAGSGARRGHSAARRNPDAPTVARVHHGPGGDRPPLGVVGCIARPSTGRDRPLADLQRRLRRSSRRRSSDAEEPAFRAGRVDSATAIAARNLPGLVEIGLLARIHMDAPTRYAITSLSRYVIVIGGVIAGWAARHSLVSQLQWLAAALSVGLGFGLQEIFANFFVSGIILLFERPFRVGDVITIEDLTGYSHAHPHACHDAGRLRQQGIVHPNPQFHHRSAGEWTLTDTRTRVIVKVGIGLRNRSRHRARILQQIAADHPLVLQDPPSRSWFMGWRRQLARFRAAGFCSFDRGPAGGVAMT